MRKKRAIIFGKTEKINRAVCWCWFNLQYILKSIGFTERVLSLIIFSRLLSCWHCTWKELHFHGILESCLCDWKSRAILWFGIRNTETASVQTHTVSITIDCSCIWQIKQGFHDGHNTLSLFLWLKMGRGANTPDETHNSEVNILSFFGLRASCVALKSPYAVT